jgi:hypothetical protein
MTVGNGLYYVWVCSGTPKASKRGKQPCFLLDFV